MSHHVEPGNILKRIGGIKMIEEEKELVDSLEYSEVLSIDEDGNLVVTKVY